MTASVFSPSWYRVARLRPRLRAHAQVHRHLFRDELWYLIQDHSTGRFHRFEPGAYAVIGLMDGRRTLDEIWQAACERLGDDMPSQDDVIRLLAQLHRADIVQADIPPDMSEVDRRRTGGRRRRVLAMMRSPLAIRLPLWDPDRFLDRTAWIARVVYSSFGAVLWLALVGSGITLAALHWETLNENLADRVLALENLLLLWCVYPVVKALHELGHAYAVKRWHGEVHEIGIMFLVFMPVPYVEASAAYAFPGKYQRMLVDGAGILVEVALAAVAMIAWSVLEPGVARTLAFNVMLIAGVSTVLFNGNPLLRFDAYYALSDWLEIPNLGARANRQIGVVLKRSLLGMPAEQAAARTRREAAWLAGYAVASFCYRMFIMLSIALFVAGKFFFIGVVLALWAVYGFLVQPTLRLLRYLVVDENMKQKRFRLVGVGLCATALVAVLLFAVPLPRTTVVEGVLWVPENARVVVQAAGEVVDVVVAPGSNVDTGDLLIRSVNPELDAEVRIAEARVVELLARQDVVRSERRTIDTQLFDEELAQSREELGRLRAEQAQLETRAPTGGVFHLSVADELPGRFLRRGEAVGYVLAPGDYRARVLVGQADIDAVRGDVRALSVRFAESFERVTPARLGREVPGAHRELPSLALSVEGGGNIALVPEANATPTTFEAFFQFEIELDYAPADRVGERVYARFVHSSEPAGPRLLRSARRVLLERLAV